MEKKGKKNKQKQFVRYNFLLAREKALYPCNEASACIAGRSPPNKVELITKKKREEWNKVSPLGNNVVELLKYAGRDGGGPARPGVGSRVRVR